MTDPFTEAARAEAEALVDDIIRWDDTIATDGPCDGTWDSLAEYLAGRGWARTHLAAQETDGERAVRELHTPREEQVVTGDCSIEECDHEDECPTVPFLVCTECWRVADEADTYFAERGVRQVAHPCPTIRALDSARAARRDEEKR